MKVGKEEVTIGDLVSLECADKRVVRRAESLVVLRIRQPGRQRFVISVLEIIACIHRNCPGIEVQNLGETDIIVTFDDSTAHSKVWHTVKTIFVAGVTFFGAAFTIMAFNNDVNITRLFEQIYSFATGEETSGFTVLEISYSAGLTLGILLFFNHFGKKRFTSDPTPMEIQMRLYENDIQTTLVENASRRGDELDVGSTDTSGVHRD